MIHIAKDGSGDFTTITAALQSLSAGSCDSREECTLFIHNGIYRERLTVAVPYVTMIGESRDHTILTYDNYARMMMPDGMKRGTFRSYSCLIDADNFTAVNLTFENRAGKGVDVGQALALYVDGDRIQFRDCRFLGGQDTLFTAPLPPHEIEANGFIGPKQNAPRVTGRHYYKNCYIEGDVDFIFGGAVAYFEGCNLFSKDVGNVINSFATAASTPEGQIYGYVMKKCRFVGNCPPHSAYLGRPWREFARTVLIDCYIGRHICEEGWNDWGKDEAHETVFYGEYGSYGPSADMSKRPEWVKRLSVREAAAFSKEAVLAGRDGWNPH